MLETIAIILVVLWILGLVTSYTMGGFIHALLVIAVVVVLCVSFKVEAHKATGESAVTRTIGPKLNPVLAPQQFPTANFPEPCQRSGHGDRLRGNHMVLVDLNP